MNTVGGYTILERKTDMEEKNIDEKEECCCCMSCKKKERSEKEYTNLLNRLSRIEGQIRGIKGMVENNAYCIDIIRQVMAASAALNSFNKELIASHIKTCVADNIKDGNMEVVDELVSTVHKLMK